MKQSLQLKIGQSLTMTPQLQQAIRLLQLSTLDLQAEIQEALDSNPLLELEDDNNSHDGNTDTKDANAKKENGENTEADIGPQEAQTQDIQLDASVNDTIPDDLPVDSNWEDIYQGLPSTTNNANNNHDDDFNSENRRSQSISLQDHLDWQLNLTNLTTRDRVIAETIIDAVKPSGLLGQNIEEILQGLEQHLEELEADEITAVLHLVQQFDPPGIAALNVSDCLAIQLKQFHSQSPVYKFALQLIHQYLPLLASRDFRQLMRKLRIREHTLQAVIGLIQSLNPHPGEHIGEDSTEYIVPDVYVKRDKNSWSVQLNPDIAPKIRVNNNYASMVKRADNSAANTFLKDNLQEAKWFIKSLQSRNETLLKVSRCIVKKQQGFFNYGPEAMKPMVLHDVAEMIDMHESTISRVTTQKYMHTPQGIFELKYFFSSHVATDTGGECSSTAIRALIKKLVANENPCKPLSDSKIVALLAEQGIKVARRTIAKYRDSLSIRASNERKQLS